MNELKVNVYAVLQQCIEQGIEAGWQRAYKHTDTPSHYEIKEQIELHILLFISEKFNFGE